MFECQLKGKPKNKITLSINKMGIEKGKMKRCAHFDQTSIK